MSQSLSKNDLLALLSEIKQEQKAEFPLTESFFKRYFKAAVFAKAKEYLNNEQVVWCEHDNNFAVINAEVVNAAGDIFYPQASIRRKGQQVSVDATCSCRVGEKCEHIAAVLLSLKTKNSGDFGKHYLLHDWFNQLEKLKSKAIQNAQSQLLFCLELINHEVVLVPKIANFSDNGDYGLGRALTAKQLSSNVTPKGLDEKDFRLLSWIRSQNSIGKLSLHDEWGALALAKMVATKRCYWGANRTSLALIHKESLGLHWHKEGEHANLKLHINGHPNWVLVPTTPPYFIDLENKQVGELDTSLCADEIKHLLTMPSIAHDLYAKTQDRILSLYGNGFIPPLLEQGQTDSSMPTPLLELNYQGSSAQLLLRFKYKQKAKNQAFENTCINQLNNFGVEISEKQADVTVFEFAASAENPAQWHWFQHEVVPQLSQQGWKVSFHGSLDNQVSKAKLKLQLQRLPNNKLTLDANISCTPLLLEFALVRDSAALINNKADKYFYVNYHQDKWLFLARDEVLQLKRVIDQYYGDKKWPKRFSLPLSALILLRPLGTHNIQFKQTELKALFELDAEEYSADVTAPLGLNAQLREYQVKGLAWLQFLRKHGLGGILADDMGLGKTLQVLSFIQWQKEQQMLNQPALVICPTSLVNNWLSEAAKFTPDLKVVVLHGANRHQQFGKANFADLVITSFPLLLRDQEMYLQQQFSNIILDEAQTIKNYQSKVSKAAKSLNGQFNLCLSGTPVENNLGELKSLLDFAMPGLLGSTHYFKEYYAQPIEKENNQERARQLTQIMSGYVLRRTKQQVATELPAKSEMVKLIELSEKQRGLYSHISAQLEQKVKHIFATGESQASKLEFLEALLKLRQICCDPRLLDGEQALGFEHSAKLNFLAQTLPEMLSEGRKVIIFSQFTSMLSLIEALLKELGIAHSLLTGQTRNRQQAIERFQQGDVDVFLISLKAGGTGLNLTAADTVIHYDPWWNPAVERQATDRAYRIGQDKPVFVYKLITANSIEEKVQRMQNEKAALADTFFDSSTSKFANISEQDMLALLQS